MPQFSRPNIKLIVDFLTLYWFLRVFSLEATIEPGGGDAAVDEEIGSGDEVGVLAQ